MQHRAVRGLPLHFTGDGVRFGNERVDADQIFLKTIEECATFFRPKEEALRVSGGYSIILDEQLVRETPFRQRVFEGASFGIDRR